MESFTYEDLSRAAGVRRVDGVDALRALAMTAVVAEHSKLFTFGWAGVWLFYVISGFVVTGALSTRADTSASARLSAFWARRCARIMPAYYIWVMLAVCVGLFEHLHPPVPTIASLLFFFNNFALASGWGDLPGFGVGNLWTVSVEMQFYALYGLLFVFAPRRVLIIVLIGLLLACPILRYAYGISLAARHATPLDAAFRVYSFSALHFDAFAYGCLLSLFRAQISVRIALRCLAAATAGLLVYAALYVVVNLATGAHGTNALKNVLSGILYGQHREAFLYIPVDLVAVSLVGLVASWDALDRRLSHPWLRHVGKVSYGAYLYHGLMLTLAGAAVSRWAPLTGPWRFATRGLQFSLAMVLVIGLASLSFTYLEQPITQRVGRALARRRFARLATADA